MDINSEILAQIELMQVKKELREKENHICSKNEKQMFIIGFCMGMQKYNELVKNKYHLIKNKSKVSLENNLK